MSLAINFLLELVSIQCIMHICADIYTHTLLIKLRVWIEIYLEKLTFLLIFKDIGPTSINKIK